MAVTGGMLLAFGFRFSCRRLPRDPIRDQDWQILLVSTTMCRAGRFLRWHAGSRPVGSEIDCLSDCFRLGGGVGVDWRRDSQGGNAKEAPCQMLRAVWETLIAWLLKSGGIGRQRHCSALRGLPAAEARRRLLHIRWARGRGAASRGIAVLLVSSEGGLE